MRNLLYSIPMLALVITGCDSSGDKKKPVMSMEVPTLTASEKLDMQVAEQTRTLFQNIETISANQTKPSTEQINLGKLLYFDKRLSKNNDISCNSCHNLKTFGVDNLSTSPGDKGQLGDRNSPTVLNAAFHTSQFWDGRASTIEEQAGMPILNPVEMAIPNEDFLIKKLSGIELYKARFAEAFPDSKNPLTYDNLKKAIGAFERTLVTPSRFDQYLNGDSEALSLEEKKGLKIFINQGCTACHSGALLGGTMFQKFGVFGNYWDYTKSEKIDEGRFTHTKKEEDKLSFKVPSLRNITETGPYFHDGSVKSLENAVKIMAKINLNTELSDSDAKSIVTFLHSLTGELPAEVTEMPEELK